MDNTLPLRGSVRRRGTYWVKDYPLGFFMSGPGGPIGFSGGMF